MLTNFKQELTQLEAIVKKGLQQGTYQAALALKQIRDRQLYKPKTFKRYCAEVLDLEERRAYQLINFMEVRELLYNCSVKDTDKTNIFIPENEGQARPLASLQPREIIEVCQRLSKYNVVTTGAISEFTKAYKKNKYQHTQIENPPPIPVPKVGDRRIVKLRHPRDPDLSPFNGNLCVVRQVGEFGAKVAVWGNQLNLFFDELAISPTSLQVSINLPTDLLGEWIQTYPDLATAIKTTFNFNSTDEIIAS